MIPDFKSHLAALFSEAAEKISPSAPEIHLERPKLTIHGDYACNIAMQLAKALKKNPRQVAAEILEAFPASEHVEKLEIAGAGFINVFIRQSSKQRVLKHILEIREAFGKCDLGKGRKIQVEFVSANPTGPL
ncbi:MAG TPA: arginine--tRNA ligase, partial [Burkholderiales bacterium]|nr:arginine--tRNA ligase [Burkholderiales bacterium]